MEELEALIFAAWERVKHRLNDDPSLLAARLARRRRPTLMCPPRAWCFAIRASDHRIASGFDEPVEHQVVISAKRLEELCGPVYLNREYLDEAAVKLGTSKAGLSAARIAGTISVQHYRGLGGRHGLIPLLSTETALDPSTRFFARADSLWGWTARLLTARIPVDLNVTLTRVPFFRSHVWKHEYDEDRHPELELPRRKSKPLPVPKVDLACWYKWSRSGHYLGTDPSNWRKSFADLGERPRRDRVKKLGSWARPRASRSGGSEHFNGFFWVCPACGERCRMLYLPAEPVNLLKDVPKLARMVDVPRHVKGFACLRCHRVRYFTTLGSDAWNQFIAYLTQGLMYGSEVPRAECFVEKRTIAFRPRNVPAPRREQVKRRLLNGWTLEQIAADMKIVKKMVYQHALAIYRQEGVSNRHELAIKLGSKCAQPLNSWELARKLRAKVEAMVIAGRTNAEIAAKYGIAMWKVGDHTKKIFKKHGVVGRKGLARKMGLASVGARS